MIVEDEDLIRTILAETLEDHGFTAVEAACGDDALILLGQQGFDLVVTDIQMPGTADGLAVGQFVSAKSTQTPVVYVTGRPDSMQRLSHLGPKEALLRKPYGPDDILDLVRKMLL